MQLSERQKEVVDEILSGCFTTKEIARHLGISKHSVITHLRRIRDKTGESRREGIILWALRNGWKLKENNHVAENV